MATKKSGVMNVDHIFEYHAPRPDQIPKYGAIRKAAREFAKVLMANTPAGPDQAFAIRYLRMSVMVANASIALEDEPETKRTLPPLDTSLD